MVNKINSVIPILLNQQNLNISLYVPKPEVGTVPVTQPTAKSL
jgi:hypothetical protein